jgi:hypothetical protein
MLSVRLRDLSMDPGVRRDDGILGLTKKVVASPERYFSVTTTT